jgi:hypothetical protein
MSLLLRLLAVFGIGYVTWLLVLLRGIALEKRRVWPLCGLIFADECLGLGAGIWLARHGTPVDVVALASAGVVAALTILWRGRHGE